MSELKKKIFGPIRKASINLFAAVVVALISLLFPRFINFNFEYSLGGEWNHENVYAPFDYPLLKNDTLYKRELNEVENNILPIYIINTEKGNLIVGEIVSILYGEIRAYEANPGISEDDLASFLNQKYSEGVSTGIERDEISLLIGNTEKIIKSASIHTPGEIVEDIKRLLTRFKVKLPDPSYENILTKIKSNVDLDRSATQRIVEDSKARISRSNGLVRNGDLVVTKGELISYETDRKLSSLRQAYRSGLGNDKSWIVVFLGYFLLTILIIGALLLYIKTYFPDVIKSFRKTSFILIWPLIFSYLVYAIDDSSSLSSYLIPFCIVPIIIKNFIDERMALFVHIVVVLIASFLSELGYEFTFLHVLAGIVTVLVVHEIREWEKFFKALGVLLAVYFVSYLGLSFISEGQLSNVNTNIFMWLGINVLLTMLAYPFIPLLERIFGFTSSITLAELSDMNKPLLRELSIKAPGTLQHSLQVAHLSEAAADKIGADSLLVKTAALYHDIGKTLQPMLFIENQMGGISPHEKMTYFESAKTIIDHVIEGEKLAKKYRLPQVIIDFINTHHGTTRVEYFYRKQLEDFPDKEFDETLFRYPGPNPRTKEETIMMLADSIEASSKSLKNPTGVDIDRLVDKIVAGKISQRQLENSALSFEELEICVGTFKQILRNIYHVRIEYPEEPKNDQEE